MNKTERIRQDVSPIIGFNIRRLREQKRLRNSGLVAKLQLESIPISTSILSKIEQGACSPTTAQLIALRKILGCDYSDFLQPCLTTHFLGSPLCQSPLNLSFSAYKIFSN